MKTPVVSSAFCYGTLMAPEVMQILLGRVPPQQSAVLLGSFRRHPVLNFVYPGLIRAKGDLSTGQQGIQGVLYRDLTENELKRLDYFEGSDYEKISCDVETIEENEKVTTQLYLWINPSSELDLTRTWSYEQFYRNNLASYLVNAVQPCRDEYDKLDDK